jgi:hypothetical protein
MNGHVLEDGCKCHYCQRIRQWERRIVAQLEREDEEAGRTSRPDPLTNRPTSPPPHP